MLEPAGFPFQDKLVDAMVNAAGDTFDPASSLFVAVDMGLGKTRCAIKAAARLKADRVLVPAPTIGLVSWPAEIAKWAPDAYVAAYSDADMLGGYQGSRQEYAIVPYSEISLRPHSWVASCQRYAADLVIPDEAHYLANPMSTRTQALYGSHTDLADGIIRPGQTVFPLSGTPAPNYTSELWPHLHALAPSVIRQPGRDRAMSEQEYLERFAQVRTSPFGQHIYGSQNTPALRAMTSRFFYRLRKSQVRSDMPPIVWTMEPLPVSAATAAHQLDIPDTVDDAGLLDWLRASYPSGSSLRKAVGLAKVAGGVEWARHFLEGSDRKLILFAWHTEVVAALHAALRRDFGSVVITGATTLKQRAAAVSAFQSAQGPRVFVGQMLAAGTAITLTAASDVAFLEDDWTPATMAQAAARADRLGQTRGVVARILYTPGTKDERIARVRLGKAREQDLMFN